MCLCNSKINHIERVINHNEIGISCFYENRNEFNSTTYFNIDVKVVGKYCVKFAAILFP